MSASYFLPYEFAPTILVLAIGATALYIRGLFVLAGTGRSPFWPRTLAYLLGVVLMYFVLQTHFDYMAQHMFFLHRLQHLVLHHMAPFLIIIAAPGTVLAAGVPARGRRWLGAAGRFPLVKIPYRIVQQPAVAAVLFVGLIYLWLMPGIHFYAMLNVPLYRVMNWSMAFDGLLFWYLMLGSRGPEKGGLRYGWRIVILALIIFPQIVVGAFLALSSEEIYQIYGICGRLWPISPIEDQRLGGLITWIPAGMMSVLGALIVLHRMTHPRASSNHAHKTNEDDTNAYA